MPLARDRRRAAGPLPPARCRLRSPRPPWFANVRGDLLAGLVVALALIPEAIAFSIIAGVDPRVGLYASFCIAVVIACVGGRPGMIAAATGAMALVMVTLVFARKVGRVLDVASTLDEVSGTRTYLAVGQVFFASADRFVASFDFREAVQTVRIDVSGAHFWDITAIGALDKAVVKFRRAGVHVQVDGLNQASATLVARFGVHDKPDVAVGAIGH